MDEFKNEILNHTFTQFADNQISKEQSFIKILGFLGAVIFGYAYVFKKFSAGDYSLFDLGIVTLTSTLLLAGGSWLIVAIGYTFRRDQHVNAKIKMKAEIIGENNFFPLNYNPLSIYCLKKNSSIFNLFMESSVKEKLKQNDIEYINMIYLRWLPDIFLIYYLLFPIFIFLINSLYAFEYFYSSTANSILFWPNILLCLLIAVTVLLIPIKYSRKLLRRLLVWSDLISFGELSELTIEEKKAIKKTLKKLRDE